MARLRRASPSSEGAVTPLANKMEEGSESPSASPSSTKGHSSGMVGRATPNKCKRPMNAFMLFAKKYRVEYTQMHPGKDNRFVSQNPFISFGFSSAKWHVQASGDVS